MSSKSLAIGMLIASAWIAAAHADDRSEYNRRAAQRDMELFHALDRNGDGMLTREEAKGDLNLGPRFDDIDINRDGIVTVEELQRYIGQQYGVDTQVTAR